MPNPEQPETLGIRRHHRRSIRLKGYDYSKPGAYFVTFCLKDRDEMLFGNIQNNLMKLNEFGKMVMEEYENSFSIRKELEMDEYVVMPNHLHGIIHILNGRGDRPVTPTHTGPKPKSISSFIAGFKSSVTKKINSVRNTPKRTIWQRNFHDHIIRNENELNRIRHYIRNNPAHWDHEDDNPFRSSPFHVAMPNPQTRQPLLIR